MSEKEFIELLEYAGWEEPYLSLNAKIYANEIYILFEACKELNDSKKISLSVIYEALNKIISAAK